MLDSYPVYLNDQQVGTVCIKQEGLYLQFSGILNPMEQKMWRVIACSDRKEIDLGICLFENGNYIIKKKMPAKRFETSDWSFKAISPQMQKDCFATVSEQEPFERLDYIENSRLSEDGSGIFLDGDQIL